MRNVFRLTPQLPAGMYKTYGISQPLATHFRVGSCIEAECMAYTNGWRTVLDESTELGKRQAYYITHQSGRKHSREPMGDGKLVAYLFEAGQKCFATHQIPLERDPFFFVRGGDWRGDPTGNRPTTRNSDDWVDDFANHQQHIADQLEKG